MLHAVKIRCVKGPVFRGLETVFFLMKFAAAIIFGSIFLATGVNAAAIQFEGFADARLIAPSAQDTYLDGGLGKLRYGEEMTALSSLARSSAELRGQQDNWFAQADGHIIATPNTAPRSI